MILKEFKDFLDKALKKKDVKDKFLLALRKEFGLGIESSEKIYEEYLKEKKRKK